MTITDVVALRREALLGNGVHIREWRRNVA